MYRNSKIIIGKFNNLIFSNRTRKINKDLNYTTNKLDSRYL